ncbi:MAG: periplasmic heavy metal sensor [Bacteroidales bacterium]|nr:MAG: periplasmic heavy metal sensor [Bacteroidales bacterium]
MNFFTRTRFLLAVIIILSAIIVAMFATMGYNKYRYNNRQSRSNKENREAHQLQNEKEKSERGRFMAKQLQFTPEQMKEFDNIRDKFHKDINELMDESKQISKDIMEEITSEKPDTSRLKSLSAKFGETQKVQKEMMIKHLLEVRSKCSPSQQANFKKVLRRIENHDRMYRERRQNTEERERK